jgi:DNA-binding CsgD family transcriptional regulator
MREESDLPSDAPGQVTYAHAKRAYLEGDPEDALELCEAAVASDARERSQLTIIRLRALMKLHHYDTALQLLDRSGDVLHGDDVLIARVLQGTALIRQGAADRGLAQLQALRAEAACAPDAVRDELALGIALAHYVRREFERVEDALRDVRASDRTDYVRTLMYRGYVAVQRNDYPEAVTIFKRALDDLGRSGAGDLAVEQNVVTALSLIAVELLDGTLWAYVDERARRCGLFNPGALHTRFVFQYARSIYTETQGWPGEALLAARNSARAASTAQERLLALCRRATVHLRYGERLAYGDLAISIRDRFRALEPESVKSWEVTTIPLAVAEVLALMGDVNGAAAAAEFGMRDTTPSADEWSGPITDAYRSHVRGLLAEAKGESLRAQHAYRRAFRLYAEHGFAHRAMIVALQAVEIGADSAMLAYLEEHSLGLTTESWIVRRCDALGARRHDPMLGRLSSSDREVLAMLFEGRTTAEIAAHRNRSQQTVRNTISRLNHAFGVENRQALVRECVRRKLFAAN